MQFNFVGEAVQRSDAMAAIYLLANANVDSSQHLYIFADAALHYSMLSPLLSSNYFAKAVKFETDATVLRQCDEKHLALASLVNAVFQASSATTSNSLPIRRHKMTADEIHTSKATKAWGRCGINVRSLEARPHF